MLPKGHLASWLMGILSLSACAASPPKDAEAPTAGTTAVAATAPLAAASRSAPAASSSAAESSPPAGECDLVCEGARLVSPEVKRHAVNPDETADAYTQQAVADADRILSDMHDDLLACYTARLRERPKAHGFLTVNIVIGPTGAVQNVETQGGALLGDAAMSCIVQRIKRATFDPPHGGGTMRLEVPFTLRRVGPGETI